MKSHRYDFSWNDLSRLAFTPLLALASVSALFHLAGVMDLLPRPRPMATPDETILTHQAEASDSRRQPAYLLSGDSSCLMDVSGRELAGRLGEQRSVLCLATLSYLSAEYQGELVRRFISRNPNWSGAVVLLYHPRTLRGAEAIPQYGQLLDAYFEREVFCGRAPLAQLQCWTGGRLFRDRLWNYAVPPAFRGPFGDRYGFAHDLDRYLADHLGTAVDPTPRDLSRWPNEFRGGLNSELEAAFRAVGAQIPDSIQLMTGITPLPESLAAPDYSAVYAETLAQWSAWVGSDFVLERLPPTMPDRFFATWTHLTETGAELYTRHLASELERMQRSSER